MARQAGDSDFTNVNVATCFKTAGTKVLGTQGSAIAFTAATSNVASEITNMSNAIEDIVSALETHGLIAT